MNIISTDHPFTVAVRALDLATVDELLNKDPSLANAFIRGDVSLTGKAWKGGEHLELAEDDPHRLTALHFAAFHGHDELAILLVEAGSNLSETAIFRKDEEWSAIELAAWEGSLATLRILLEAADAQNLNPKLEPALNTALGHGATEKADLLREHGAQLDIFTASMAGETEAVKRFLDADPKCATLKRPPHDLTPLDEAVTLGKLAVARVLVKYFDEVPPHISAALGRVGEIENLLKADPDSATKLYGPQRLLTWALKTGQVEVMKVLLENGADPNGGDQWGIVPLRDAAQVTGEIATQVVDLLVAKGADVNRESKSFTPIAAARGAKNQFVIDALIRHGAKE